MTTDGKFAPLEDWLFSYLTHELRTPLNAMLGFSRMMQDGAYGDLNDQQQDRIERVVRSSETLIRRLDLLLDFHRLQSEQLDFYDTPVQLADLLKDALQASDYDSRGRPLQVVTTPPMPDVLLAVDRTWAGVALREVLLHAASEAMPDPAVHVMANVAADGTGIAYFCALQSAAHGFLA
jgi:signal transduction histidine kinase